MPWCVPLWVQLLWDSLRVLDFLESISFTRLGKFSFIICLNKFSIFCCSSSPSGIPMIQMFECLKLSQSFLSLSLFFRILVSSFCSKSLIQVPVSFPSLLVPGIFLFISLRISSCILHLYSIISLSILIISVLNCI